MSADRAARLAADAEARRRPQHDFECPLVVEAGAGTGKTAVLVSRILAWCLGPGWERAELRLHEAGTKPPDDFRVAAGVLRGVVAITFTEAAAAEMAARVGEGLLRIERGDELPVGVDAAALPADAAQRAARARALVATLDQLVVRTIHAWCRRLLVAQPLEAGLHPGFEVDADGRRTREVLREVLEARLAEAYSGAGAADHLLLALQEIGPPQVEEALLRLLEAGLPAGVLERDPFDGEAVSGLHRRLLQAFADFAEAEAGALSENTRARLDAETGQAVLACRDLLSATAWQSRADLEAQLPELRGYWGEPTRSKLLKWTSEDFTATARTRLEQRQELVARRARHLLARVDHVLALDLEHFDAARRVLAPLLAEVWRELRQRGIESFDALLRDTRALLVDDPAAASRVRREIEQILVDEFQDTDPVQCGILRVLALEGPVSERPGLFLVGDPKQSIYGWRNADLAAYYGFVDAVVEAGGVQQRLSMNFRSVPEILDEVERVIAPVMRPEAHLQPPFERLEPCPARMAEAPTGFAPVEHWVDWGWEVEGQQAETGKLREATEREARAVARDLAALHAEQGVAWGDVALLLRSLGDQETYLGALRDAGIPYVVERDRSYYLRREIIEASAVVRCILDPRDHVALLALLRSASVGTPDAALIPLWHGGLPALASALGSGSPDTLETLRGLAQRVADELPAVPGIERIRGWEHGLVAALEALAELRRSHLRDAPDRFVEALRTRFGAERCEAQRYLAPYRLANLDRFYRDLVSALEETGGDVGFVLAHLRGAVSEAREQEEGRPRDASDQAVQVLSIHKAKGLDWSHVYLLQLHKGSPRELQQNTRAAEWQGHFEYQLFGPPSPAFDLVQQATREVEAVERVRTLYVAMTRAKQRLVLASSYPTKQTAFERVSSHAQLLPFRHVEPPALERRMAELAGGAGDRFDEAEARWVFPALQAGDRPPGRADAPASAEVFDASALEASVRALAERRRAAELRAARPFRAVASREVEARDAEARAGSEEHAEAGPRTHEAGPSREVALVVGTALHAALEVYDPEAPAATAAAQAAARMREVLRLELAEADRARGTQRAEALLQSFLEGPLRERLVQLAPHLLARELPLHALSESDAGPVGFVAGAVDLLYRDPQSAALVVVDYKTDAGTQASYVAQGRVYCEALRRALALDQLPRFELWYLETGRVEVVPLSG